MPSCQACGKWYSEEDNGCGCDNESLSMTRKELREMAARVLELEASRWERRKPNLTSTAIRYSASKYRSGELEVPSE